MVIWLGYILSEGDHRKVGSAESGSRQRRTAIEQVCGLQLRETDFTDDRLGIVLRKLSDSSIWQGIESELSRQNHSASISYRASVWRLDATTVSSYRLVSESGLFQFGHCKDDPSLPHLTAMLGSLEPLGMPLATHVVSGEQADDGLYLPIFEQVRQSFETQGLLWVGGLQDGCASHSGLQIHQHQHYYLTPLARVGKVPQLLVERLTDALSSQSPRVRVKRPDKKGQLQEIASGYECSRMQQMELADGITIEWTERVLLVHSPAHARQQQRGLERRLQRATEKVESPHPRRRTR